MDRSTDGTRVLVPTVVSERRIDDVRLAVEAWLAGYGEGTQQIYRAQIARWLRWTSAFGLAPLDARRSHLETFGSELTGLGLADSTVAKVIGTVASWYRYLAEERFIDHDPMVRVRRPKVDDEVQRPYLDRSEMARFLATAERCSHRDYALAALLCLTGLRISAALSANIETIRHDRGHTTITVRSKNRKIVDVPLPPRALRAILSYIGERSSGPIFVTDDGSGQRWSRNLAYRRVRAISKAAGIDQNKRIGCHSLRRSFITAALDAGVPLRDVQHSVHHKNPATTSRYDQNRQSNDRFAGYIVGSFVGA